MPDFSRAKMLPHIARVRSGATDYQMVPKDVRAILQAELQFNDSDRDMVGGGGPRWWQAALNAVTGGDGGVQRKGWIDTGAGPGGNRWRLTDPAGISWAREIVTLHADQMRLDRGQSIEVSVPGVEPSGSDEDEDSLPYQPDARVRKAVEVRAVELAKEKYAAEYEIRDVGKPYDLECTHKTSGEVRHVEVKGFRDGEPTKVILTRNELAHVREGKFPVDLVVAVGIEILEDGPRRTGTGGVIPAHLYICDWQPADDDLTVFYTYKLSRSGD